MVSTAFVWSEAGGLAGWMMALPEGMDFVREVSQCSRARADVHSIQGNKTIRNQLGKVQWRPSCQPQDSLSPLLMPQQAPQWPFIIRFTIGPYPFPV
jgi:hypothetical protein